MMTIKFDTAVEWYNAIAALVERGITFEAHSYDSEYTITCTGGY